MADPKQFPPEECEHAAQWVIDAFAEVGLQSLEKSPTPDGSMAVHGHADSPDGAPTVLLYCHYDVQPPLGEAQWLSPVWELTERDGRWYGRGAADCKGNIVMHLTALRALKQVPRRFPLRHQADQRGLRGTGHGRAGGVRATTNAELLRADTILVCDTGNFAVGVPTLTTTLRGMTSVDVTVEALHSAMHSGMFGGPAPDPVAGLIAMLASIRDSSGNTTIDGLENTQTWTRRRLPGGAVPARTPRCSDGVDLIGSGSVADMLWARPGGDGARDRHPAGGRFRLGGPGLGGRAREPADPARHERQGVPGRADRAPEKARAVEPSLHDRARRRR